MSFSKSIVGILVAVSLTISLVSADMTEDSKIIGVSGGENHTLVLTADNGPWACGINAYYQLGIGEDTSSQLWFVPVHDGDMNTDSNCLEDIIQVSAGWMHSLALDVNGFVWAWGSNGQGQLGDNYSVNPARSPIQVHGPNNVGYLDGIISISAGRSGEYSLAVDINGNAWAWGFNANGQLGAGDTEFRRLVPVIVVAGEQEPNNPNGPLRNITGISAGADHSVAVDVYGFVYAWGDNRIRWSEYGRLGNGSIVVQNNSPVRVHAGEQNSLDPCSPLKNIISVAVGWEHTLALECLNPADPNCKGRVYAWGNNNYFFSEGNGQLGDGTLTNRNRPVFVHAGQQNPSYPDSNLEEIIAVSAGQGHSIALDVNGQVWAWGGNNFGQLGDGSTASYRLRPVKVLRFDGQPLSGITTISAGYWHNLAIDVNGILWVWGMGSYGRLGLGDEEQKNLAHPVPPVFNTTQGNFRFGIQPSIDDSNNSDILELLPMTYLEQNINFGIKAVTLKGAAPDDWQIVEKTIIQGKGNQSPDIPILRFNNNSGSTVLGLTLQNSDFGILTSSSSPVISKCIITDCNIDGIRASEGSNIQVIDSNIFSNTNVGINISGTSSLATIRNSLLHNNYRGLYGLNGSSTFLSNSKIFFNSNIGILIYNAGATVVNNWIYKNTLDGIYSWLTPVPLTIRNNTIISNLRSGIMRYGGSNPNITSSIVWGHISVYGDIYGSSATYSWLTANGDPIFVDAGSDNFHLDTDSLCIDTGAPDFDDFNETDIDGECRLMKGKTQLRVDIGADEYYWPRADYNLDEIVNFFDFAVFAPAWKSTNNPSITLDSDNDVDIYDLSQFCKDWLWVAPWSSLYEMLAGQSEGDSSISAETGESSELVDQTSDTIAAEESLSVEEPLAVQESAAIEETVDNQEDSSLAGEGETAGIWLVYKGNTMPESGEEITVYLHSDPMLLAMGTIVEVAGDAEITAAMSEADCNNFGWDNGWNSDPYIDPAGWLYVSGVSWGGVANGTIGYFKFRYYSGEVTVSINGESSAYDPNSQPVLYSGEPLIFGRDPNE